MSSSRSRFASVASSLRSASRFCALYFVMPAASSKIARRSSGRDDRIMSILPCSMIEYAERPMPVSMKSCWMSFSRHGVLFSRYSLLPSLKTRRVIVTSCQSSPSCSSHSEKVIETSAIPTPARESVPLKITSAISPPRSALADCSPSTHRMASSTLDFPHPFGPTTAVTPR